MHEHLQLDRAVFGGCAQLGKAHLARQNRPGKAKARQLANARRAVHAHLGRGVQRRPGHIAPDKGGHRKVLHNYGVHPGGIGRPQCLACARQLALHQLGVKSQVAFYAARTTKSRGLLQGGGIKIARRTAGIKVGKAQIYGVRPSAHGGLQRLLVACGRQYLRHGGRTGPHQWFSFK